MSKRRKYQDVSNLMIQELPDRKIPAKPHRPKKNGSAFSAAAVVFLPLKILGSFTVGVVITTVLSLLLAWGTFIESEYGAAIARFALYDSLWFALLLGIFAVNLLTAMLIRFPWKRYHAPFLIAHCGILVLLFGCYLTWRNGEIAQITLPEGAAGTKAIKTDQQHFTVHTTLHDAGTTQNAVDIPFEPGPFNWEDYNRDNWAKQNRRYRASLGLAMQWGRRDFGELRRSSLKDVKIEVINYLVNSETEPVLPLDLSLHWKKPIRTVTEFGEVKETPRNWERIQLEIKPQGHFGRMEIRGVQTELSLGERINYRSAASMSEVEAFRNARPDWNNTAANTGANAGTHGQIVLYYNGRNHSIDVDRLIRETAGNQSFRVDGIPFTIGSVQFNPRGPLIAFTLNSSEKLTERLTLFPDNPEMNIHAQKLGVFGYYWLQSEKLSQNPDYAGHPILQRIALPRLDFIQGTDKKLYYRLWNGQNIVTDGVVPNRVAGKKTRFTIAPQTPGEVEIVIEHYAPQDFPGLRVVALPVGKDYSGNNTEQRVQLRVTVDGKEETFWLRAVEKSVVPLPPERDQIRYVHGNSRTVQIQWNYDTVDLGFGVFLKKFEMRTEPGTRMSSHYSSLVDFVEIRDKNLSGFSRSLDDFRTLGNGRDVLISMNRPTVFQGAGRSFRVYQSSYSGPYFPDNPWFHELYDGKIFPWEKLPREAVYMSTLSINADPGRGLKYLGCFLIIFGTIWLIQRTSRRNL
jgi:hypothetical protein